MGLLDIARQDIQDIASDLEGFAVSAIFTAPTGEVLTVNVLHTKHHRVFNMMKGEWEDGKNAHVSIAEALFTAGAYPVRNSNGDVHLKGHMVQVADSTGTVCKYRIKSWWPSETFGLIVCELSDAEAGDGRIFDNTHGRTFP